MLSWENTFRIQFSEYYLTDNNELCPDNVVDDLESCKESLAYIRKTIPDAMFWGLRASRDRPKGCYLIGNSVDFNIHASGCLESCGSRACPDDTAPCKNICRSSGKKPIWIFIRFFHYQNINVINGINGFNYCTLDDIIWFQDLAQRIMTARMGMGAEGGIVTVSLII